MVEWKSSNSEKSGEKKEDTMIMDVMPETLSLELEEEVSSISPQKNVVFFYQRKKRRKVCKICAENLKIDYKNIDLLSKFLNEQAKILSRRKTGTCPKHQHQISKAVKRARELALLPYSGKLGE